MRPFHFLGTLFCIVLVSVSLAAQGRPTGGGGGGGRPATGGTTTTPGNAPSTTQPPIMNNPSLSATPMVVFLSGKVRVDDGSELTDAATIESMCNGDRHFEAYTDRKGNFSFEFGKDRNQGSSDVATTSTGMYGQPRTALQQRRELQQCELVAVLPGFTSQTIELAAVDMNESMNVGTIVLHRLAQVEGLTISATTAMAPSKARKAYDKGRDEEQKKKWSSAEKKFQEAVQLYPKFAAAWLELARVQLQNNDLAGAQQSLQQSVAADPKFVSPHEVLAVLAFQQKNWQEVLDQTGAVLRLNPLSFAKDWYMNSAANYYLAHYGEAEKAARQGIQTDVEHKIPKMEYLLGAILAQKRDYQGAAEHLRNYVRLAPKAADVPEVNQQIAKIEKLTSTAATTSK
ncbi:MAG TPA: tetratricopeptide repeat protein [Terriglobales bacterium]|nr:tetratricopeptide repeat protein [Terriglobales bacterium]